MTRGSLSSPLRNQTCASRMSGMGFWYEMAETRHDDTHRRGRPAPFRTSATRGTKERVMVHLKALSRPAMLAGVLLH